MVFSFLGPMTTIATIQANSTGTVRRETVDGRAYLVAPVVAIRAGVLNGELVPEDEIGRYPLSWSGIPLPISHPRDAGGNFISANDSPALASRHVGRFYAPRMEGGALKGELWVDLKAAERSPEGKEVVRRLEAGEPLEVSTAYFRDLEMVSGTHEGTPYTAVSRNVRPDHLALLPNEIGACSWVDGCGAPRVNSDDTAGGGSSGGLCCKDGGAAAVTAMEESAMANVDNEVGGAQVDAQDVEEIVEEVQEDATTGDATVEGDPTEDLQADAPATDPAPATNTIAVNARELAELRAMAQVVRSVGGAAGLRSILERAANEERAQRARTVADLRANARNPFTDEEIAQLPTGILDKVARSLTTPDYSGLGAVAPAANVDGAELGNPMPSLWDKS